MPASAARTARPLIQRGLRPPLPAPPHYPHTPQSLNLMGNKLTALPDSFGELSGLRRLGLKSNALAQLPASFTRLTDLLELFITDNKLTGLPEGFGALASLVKLQASFNPWDSLPPGLLALPRLELFRLAAGALPAWPAAKDGGPRLPPALAWCSLGDNPAAAVPPRIVQLPEAELSEVGVDRVNPLGEGASGECFRGAARW
jgi:Leucine-rich repeat (LRR) protein